MCNGKVVPKKFTCSNDSTACWLMKECLLREVCFEQFWRSSEGAKNVPAARSSCPQTHSSPASHPAELFPLLSTLPSRPSVKVVFLHEKASEGEIKKRYTNMRLQKIVPLE
jgi:hypothetical protein